MQIYPFYFKSLFVGRKLYFDFNFLLRSLLPNIMWVIDFFREKDSGTSINDPH